MNKNLLIIVLTTLLFGCTDTIEFNNPALQGNFEGQSWRANVQTATIENAGFSITGQRGGEILVLSTNATNLGEYILGDDSLSEARFIGADGTVYSTLNTPDPSVQVFPSDGLIEITEFNTVTNTVTAIFRFNAFSDDGLNSVNFIDGIVFEVPIQQNNPQ